MYYSFNEIYEPELIGLLWSAGIKNLDIINKIININKQNKMLNINQLEDKSRKYYIELDSAGEYHENSKKTIDIDWINYTGWNNIHKELIIWYRYFYTNSQKKNKNNIMKYND